MALTISPNMMLPIPGVGTEAGPQYALDINNSLTLIDQHNHTAGYGALVPVSGLDINADISMNSFNLIAARTLRLDPQTSTPVLPTDVGILYEKGVDLYYVDGSGNDIRITQSGSVSGSAGTITGLPSGTASASFAASTFTFQSATSTAANIDGRSFILRNATASSAGLTLSPPNAMVGNYTLVLPSIPAAQSFLTLDTSGNIGASIAFSGGILGTNIASSTITNTNIANSTITNSKLAPTTLVFGPDSGAFATNSGSYVTIFSQAFTASGTRPVEVSMVSSVSSVGLSATGIAIPAAGGVTINLQNTNGTILGAWNINNPGTAQLFTAPSIIGYDFPAAGGYTYKADIALFSGGGSPVTVAYYKLMIREI